MNPIDGQRLAEARRQLPQMALRLGSREAVRDEFMRVHPDLLPVLGEAQLPGWIWANLRQLKEADSGQLPLFGQFAGEIRTRDEWTEDNYRAYYKRYANAATRNAAKLSVLAAEFEDRFGHGMDELV